MAVNPRVQPSFQGRSAGSFPEQRLVIEPTRSAVAFLICPIRETCLQAIMLNALSIYNNNDDEDDDDDNNNDNKPY